MTALTTPMARAGWEALGTSVELLVSDGDALAQARAIVERELDAVDRACSRFREDSELSRVNAHAGRTLGACPLLIEAIDVALRAARLTDGDVDPTVGVALELAGYDRDWRLLAHPGPVDRPAAPTGEKHAGGEVPASGKHAGGEVPASDRRAGGEVPASDRRAGGEAPTGEERAGGEAPSSDKRAGGDELSHRLRVLASIRPGWQTIDLNRERATLRVPPGVKLDLGATAKAWAADRASGAVYDATGCGVLVSLGGDISTAGAAPERGWRVHVTDDHRGGPQAPGQTVTIVSGGLATSSTTVRRWQHENRTMHHIIDPSTGAPVEGRWRTVSVAAVDCTDANIAATAAIVRGAQAPEWLAEMGMPARLVAHDGEILTVGSWPRP